MCFALISCGYESEKNSAEANSGGERMKEKQDLHVFGEQGAWARSPVTEEQHPHCLAGQSEPCWRRDIKNAFAQTLDDCLMLLHECTSAPPPCCSRSPRGPCRAGCAPTICFPSHSQRSRLQPCPCCEDLGGRFWIVLPFCVFSLVHSCQGLYCSSCRRTPHLCGGFMSQPTPNTSVY